MCFHHLIVLGLMYAQDRGFVREFLVLVMPKALPLELLGLNFVFLVIPSKCRFFYFGVIANFDKF